LIISEFPPPAEVPCLTLVLQLRRPLRGWSKSVRLQLLPRQGNEGPPGWRLAGLERES